MDLGAETIDLTLRPVNALAGGVTSVRIDGPLAHPRATLALDNPVGVVRHALTSLLKPAQSSVPAQPGCG